MVYRQVQQAITRPIIANVAKKKVYFGAQYLGEVSTREMYLIKKTVERACPHIEAIPWFRTRKLAANAPKDPIPSAQKPMIVYSYRCACGASYVGRSERTLEKRTKEHLPKWCISGKSRPRSKEPPTSSITQHHLQCLHPASTENFKVIKQCRTTLDLRISEAVMIRLSNPSLCRQKEFTFTCSLLP